MDLSVVRPLTPTRPSGTRTPSSFPSGASAQATSARGTFGSQGTVTAPQDVQIKPETSPYGFRSGTIDNVEARRIIMHKDWASGAHSDFAHPEVAHFFWEAALTGL